MDVKIRAKWSQETERSTHQAATEDVEPLHSLIVVDDAVHPVHKQHDLAQGCRAKDRHLQRTACLYPRSLKLYLSAFICMVTLPSVSGLPLQRSP